MSAESSVGKTPSMLSPEPKWAKEFRSGPVEKWVNGLEGKKPGDEEQYYASRNRLEGYTSDGLPTNERLSEETKGALCQEMAAISDRFDNQHLKDHLPNQVSELLADTGLVICAVGYIVESETRRYAYEARYDWLDVPLAEIDKIHEAIRAGNFDAIAVGLHKTAHDIQLEIRASEWTTGRPPRISAMGRMVYRHAEHHWEPWSEEEMRMGMNFATRRRKDRLNEINKTLNLLRERGLGNYEKPVIHVTKSGCEYVWNESMTWKDALLPREQRVIERKGDL